MNWSTRCLNLTEMLGRIVANLADSEALNNATKFRCLHLIGSSQRFKRKEILRDVNVGCYGETNFALY